MLFSNTISEKAKGMRTLSSATGLVCPVEGAGYDNPFLTGVNERTAVSR